jgi:ABC-2 type transport system ATP-binding protein
VSAAVAERAVRVAPPAPAPTLSAFEARGVGYRYGSGESAIAALRGVSLRVAPGSWHALLGPNGSGKTTLFRLASTLLRPQSGQLLVGGCDVSDDPDGARGQIGVVFQSVALDEQLTLAENLRTQAALYGIGRRQATERIDALLDALALTDHARRRVATLSGGERRRGDLARGLLHRPALLLLDEPTTALDPSARRALLDLLGRLRRDEGTAILMATHLMEEASECDRVTILHRGTVAASGTPDALTDALGASVLWITPAQGHEARFTPDALGLPPASVRHAGGQIGLSHAQPARLLAQLSQAHPDAIAEATLRRPTLEDAFLAATGHALAPRP